MRSFRQDKYTRGLEFSVRRMPAALLLPLTPAGAMPFAGRERGVGTKIVLAEFLSRFGWLYRQGRTSRLREDT